MPHDVEVIGANSVNHPAMKLAQRRNDAIADARSDLEAESSVEHSLRLAGRSWVGITWMRLGRQRVQQPEQGA